MTPRMIAELYDLLVDIGQDAEAGVLVLTGAGGPGNGFCPGADIKHRLSGQAAQEILEDGPAKPEVRQLARVIRELPVVTVAAINGAVAGAGLGLALACDVRVAARSARFATAFLARGLSGDMGVTWNLTRLVGPGRAREICLLTDKFTADEAAQFGIVSRVWDDDVFLEQVDLLTHRLGSFSPPALKSLKANLIDAERLDLATYLEVEIERHLAVGQTPESRALFEQFLDGR